MTSFDAFAFVAERLTAYKFMVILDNLSHEAGKCCLAHDLNGLWYDDRFSEHDWYEM